MALTILRYCINSRLRYLVRCLCPNNPVHSDFFKRVDSIIRNTCQDIINGLPGRRMQDEVITPFNSQCAIVTPSLYSNTIVHLPHFQGGFQLPSLDTIKVAGYTASLIQSIPFVVGSLKESSPNRFLGVTLDVKDIDNCQIPFIREFIGSEAWEQWSHRETASLPLPFDPPETSLTSRPLSEIFEDRLTNKLQHPLSNIAQTNHYIRFLNRLHGVSTTFTTVSSSTGIEDDWRRQHLNPTYMLYHFGACSGPLHDWVLDPGFFRKQMTPDQYRTAMQIRSLNPCHDAVWTSLLTAPSRPSQLVSCKGNSCTSSTLNSPPTLDPYGLHAGTCNSYGGYLSRHTAIEDLLIRHLRTMFPDVKAEAVIDPSTSRQRSDIVIYHFPTCDLLTVIQGAVQYPIIIDMLLHQHIISATSSTTTNMSPPSSYTIEIASIEMHLDITFTSLGTNLAGMAKEQLIAGDANRLGDSAATAKLTKYRKRIISQPSTSSSTASPTRPGPPRILIPLQFVNIGRPHSITSKFIEYVLSGLGDQAPAQQQQTPSYIPPEVINNNSPRGSNKVYRRQELSGLIQYHLTRNMFVCSEHARCYSSYPCGVNDFDT